MRRNVGKFGKKSLKRFFLNLSILRLQSTIFEISKQPKIVNLYQDKTRKPEYERNIVLFFAFKFQSLLFAIWNNKRFGRICKC